MAAIATTNEITETAMLAAVAHAGEAPPTSDQLKRWRRAGLLPRPRLVHQGGLRGSQSLYPTWAAEQLLAIVNVHRSTHRLGDLRSALWWDGYWVEPSALRETLITPLERFSNDALKARRGEEDPYEAADAILKAFPDDGKPSEIVKLLRSRLPAPADLANLMWTLIVLALGGEAPWEQEDRSRIDPAPTALQLVTRAAGISLGTSEDPADRPAWLPAGFDMEEFMTQLRDSGGFEIEDAARPIRDASDEAIDRARADAMLFSQPLAMIGAVLQDFVGEDIAGLGTLVAIAPATTLERASLIRTMLILRQLAGDESFHAVGELVASTQLRFAAIAELRSALPEHELVLRADYEERLADLEPRHAQQVRCDVASYLRAHPSIAEALGARESPGSEKSLEA
jgi:hypothetical protein